MHSAMYRFGAKEGIKKEDYDYVFDEQIEFVQALRIAGTEESTMKVKYVQFETFIIWTKNSN